MKKENRERALQFMEAYLGLCKTFRCSIEGHVDPQDCEHESDGVEVFAWDPKNDADTFITDDRKLLTQRIGTDDLF